VLIYMCIYICIYAFWSGLLPICPLEHSASRQPHPTQLLLRLRIVTRPTFVAQAQFWARNGACARDGYQGTQTTHSLPPCQTPPCISPDVFSRRGAFSPTTRFAHMPDSHCFYISADVCFPHQCEMIVVGDDCALEEGECHRPLFAHSPNSPVSRLFPPPVQYDSYRCHHF